MKVRVLFFGPLREMAGGGEQTIECPPGETLGELFDRYPAMADMRASIVLACNREFAPLSTLLHEGDEVAFLPPVSGGVDDDVVEIVDAPIDARALAARLQRGEDGAVVTFEGVTRNYSKTRATRYLEYEAYRPMALDKMRGIIREVAALFPIHRVGIIHRLGRLEIGEASVVIVVTSAHRAAAFDACRFAIDRLKRTVPIWKKEFFDDGEIWVEGETLNPRS
jgi:molybdopterin synthase catalytic subunit/molybdopterin converting factor small subunit